MPNKTGALTRSSKIVLTRKKGCKSKISNHAPSHASLLIEIGVEELPVSYIEPAAKEFASLVCKILDENKISYMDAEYWYTPRRLVVFVKEVHSAAPDRDEEFIGPPVSAGRVLKDSEVKFLPPAIGFASKFGLKPEELKVKKTARGEYFAATITIPGVETTKLLSSEIPQIIPQLKFPKTMVWNSSGVRFARPIRNLLVLYGSKAVICKDVAGISSDHFKKTFAAGPGFSKKIVIPSADRYKETLKNTACVIVDHKERARRLLSALETAAKRSNAVLVASESESSVTEEGVKTSDAKTLFDEVNSLLEYPVCVVGVFDEKYLALPEEILVTCMKKKQKFFALKNPATGKIINKFIAVKNGISSNLEEIAANYEKVLVARLEDAFFFYKNDLEKPLDDLTLKLKGITFHEKLGNMFDKTKRVELLSEKLAVSCGLNNESIANIKRGALLSKFDLATEIVFEYPELSGAAGAIYARHAGENETVVHIIKEHYLPVYSDDQMPSSVESAIVSIADKADTIAADFSVGIIPSGSEDPYGLRRAASGVLKIIASRKDIKLSLKEIFSAALEAVYLENKKVSQSKEETLRLIEDFCRARLEALALGAKDGFAVDEVRAALAVGFDDLRDFFARLGALRDVKREKNFESILISIKRAANIIRQAEKSAGGNFSVGSEVDVSLFSYEEEKNLYSSVCDVAEKFEEAKKTKNYIGALRLLLTLSGPLEDFFNKVMVMCPDEKLRQNRLSLLNKIILIYSPLADFSKLVKPGVMDDNGSSQ